MWSGYIGYTSTQQQWFLRCLGNRKVGVGLYMLLSPRAYSCASSGEKLFIPSWWDRLVTPFSWSSSTTRSSLYIPIYTSCNHRQKWAPPFGSWVGVLCSTRTSHSRKGRRGLINNCGSTAPLSKTSFGTKKKWEKRQHVLSNDSFRHVLGIYSTRGNSIKDSIPLKGSCWLRLLMKRARFFWHGYQDHVIVV